MSKHFTYEDRIQIESLLKQHESFKQISIIVGKSPSSISREIKRNLVISNKSAVGRIANRCIHRKSCAIIQLCESAPNCLRRCSTCKYCNNNCSDFTEEICSKLSSPPYVCNGCSNEQKCTLRKKYYISLQANTNYKNVLKHSRTGVNISENELLRLDEFISPKISNGLSINHIVASNPDEFDLSQKTIYSYINHGLIKAKNVDLPRKCRLRPRKKKSLEHKVDSKCRIGRSYSDYKLFMENQPDVSIVEMDSVEGRKGGKVLLTLMFNSCSFMLAFIRDRNTSQSVIDVFNDLYQELGHILFKSLFPLLLTDNGSEFSNPKALEFTENNTHRTNVFYCDPGASYQKPRVENNHLLIRRIIPKGTSMDSLTQSDINKMMSHINSYNKASLNNKTPIEFFKMLYGEEILSKLNIEFIPANDIILKPKLLKNKTVYKTKN